MLMPLCPSDAGRRLRRLGDAALAAAAVRRAAWVRTYAGRDDLRIRHPPQRAPPAEQGYRIWNFAVLRRGRRLGFRPLWLSLGRRDALVRRKLGRRGSYAIALH